MLCSRASHLQEHLDTVGEEFRYRREGGNANDPYAVSVTQRDTIVGHVARKISAACSMFLRREGMTCTAPS